ncbi:response regulator transcription factor [Stenotrophomonas sp.]|uniref:response regulator transcription factor n=1 Tax=Stenotrophomonas sp. TaxID=69392 RepID=UPI00289E4CAB|nr:response regulator transcription factor [Stenotrophomonas sp.]
MNTTPFRVAVADDHPMVRMGIESSLDAFPMIRLIGSVADSTELVALLDAQPCDVLITDFAMPGGVHGDGLQLLDFLHERYAGLLIVVMTGIDQPVMIQAILSRPVAGLLSKADDVSHVALAVTAAHANRRYLSPTIAALSPSLPGQRRTTQLSPREQQVLSLYVDGKSIGAIAEQLQLRKQTVSTQKVSGMAKLGIERDADLFKYAAELGLVGQDGDRDP